MDDPNITMEEYIRLEEEKAHRHGNMYNWETATYGKIWYDEYVHDLRSVETEFLAIVFNDTLMSEPMDLVKEISTNIDGEFTNLEILMCWSLETSRLFYRVEDIATCLVKHVKYGMIGKLTVTGSPT
ncbi:hypothetical protein Tco_0683352 [Tanacetum coccineum]|uniref:Uncharacterized protein n=1 Tax=Tanacetum coccineum TaxID=301880 RepID=A0ABQ4XVG9_9ASTR